VAMMVIVNFEGRSYLYTFRPLISQRSHPSISWKMLALKHW